MTTNGPVVSELALVEGVREVAIPYNGNDYVCPSCAQPIPTRKQIRLSKPARWEERLNDVLKCPFCNFIFSPKMTARVISE